MKVRKRITKLLLMAPTATKPLNNSELTRKAPIQKKG
jgi:hypothetical protein